MGFRSSASASSSALCIIFLLALTAISSCFAQSQEFSIAILSDVHIGDAKGIEVIQLAQSAVAKINSLAKQDNIQLVFMTGGKIDAYNNNNNKKRQQQQQRQ